MRVIYENGHMSAARAARELGVAYSTVRALLETGVLKGGRYGPKKGYAHYVTIDSMLNYQVRRVTEAFFKLLPSSRTGDE